MANDPNLWKSTPLYGSALPDAEAVNARIWNAFRRLEATDFAARTHFFHGRYENLYLKPGQIPEVEQVLRYAESCARQILGIQQPLRIGGWLNLQEPGQSTTEHTHEEVDELLSGVYYVRVPEGSGALILRDGALQIRAQPREGHFFFFPPSLPHRVEENRSAHPRLSLAFNLGLAG